MTDGGRVLTLAVEAAREPPTWLVITGWEATDRERKMLRSRPMHKDPWTDPDPQPGDFDAEIGAMSPDDVEIHERNAGAELTVLVGVNAEDARRVSELAAERQTSVEQVVAELVRNA